MKTTITVVNRTGPFKFEVTFPTPGVNDGDERVLTLELHPFWSRLDHAQRVTVLSALSQTVFQSLPGGAHDEPQPK